MKIRNEIVDPLRFYSGETLVDPTIAWRDLGGDYLLQMATKKSLSVAAISLATNLPMFVSGQEEQFCTHIGLTDFCIQNAEMLREGIQTAHEDSWEQRQDLDPEVVTFAKNVPMFCPELLSTPSLNRIAVLQTHYAYAHPLIDHDSGNLGFSITRENALAESATVLEAANDKSLLRGIWSV